MEATRVANKSYGSLPASAVALLRVLSMLDGKHIPEFILYAGTKDVGLENYPRDIPEYSTAIDALASSSLIVADREIQTLTIHHPVQVAIQQELKVNIVLFGAVFDTAVTLLTTIWPSMDHTSLNQIGRLTIVKGYYPHVMALKSMLDLLGDGHQYGTWKPGPNIAVLLNEISWYHILCLSGSNLEEAAMLTKLSKQLLKLHRGNNLKATLNKHLTSCCRNRAMIDIYTDNKDAVSHCQEWIAMLVDRIQKYKEIEDIKTLPMAYNEMGIALMRVPDPQGALDSWEMSCKTIEQYLGSEELPCAFPWMHRALVTAFKGDTVSGLSILIPVLEERERKLGINDTDTLETGLMLSCMGVISHLRGYSNEAYEFNKRVVEVFTKAMGASSRWTFKAYYRLACDHFDRGQYEEAKILLQKCLDPANQTPWNKLEFARAAWKLALTLEAQSPGGYDAKEHKMLLVKAQFLLRQVDSNHTRPMKDMSDDHWDSLVFYLFR